MAPSNLYKHGLLGMLCLAPTLVHSQSSKADSIKDCLTRAGVHSTISTDKTWVNDTLAFQSRLPPHPVCIAFPETKDHVASALACAREASVKVSVVSRAHSFQGYGMGYPGNLVINIRAFTKLSFDHKTNQLTFGGASNVGPAVKYLHDNFKRHIPHVRNAHVGLCGSSMGGGFGPTSRFDNIPSDNLVSIEYMLYNGTVINAGLGSDLLWGAQGAGPNFGVALSLTTKTYELPYNGAVSYKLAVGAVDTNVGSTALLAIQKWVLDGHAPDKLSLRFSLSTFASVGYYYGPESDFDSAMAPLVKSLQSISPALKLTKTILRTFWESEEDSTIGINLPDGGALSGRSSFVQSWTTTNQHPFNLTQAKSLLEAYQSLNRTDLKGTGFLDLWAGVSRDIADSDHAFAHGKNLWLVRVDGVGNNGVWPKDGLAYMQNVFKPFENSLKELGPLRSFVNYVNSELSVQEWSSRLYGDNFERLRKIKAAVDPTGLFSGYGLAIPTTKSGSS